MATIFKILRNAVILALLPLHVFAQATADELLDGYVSASVHGENTTPYITKINQTFKSYRNDEQALFLVKISERINKDTIVNQQNAVRKIALIDLYALLADSNDGKLDDLYFQKGEICGLHTGDTIMLKDCITGLKLSNQSKTPKVNDYITTLQDYLEQIRNYVPASRRIDGIWVSNLQLTNSVELMDNITLPFYVLIVNGNSVQLDINGYGGLLAEKTSMGKIKDVSATFPQRIDDISPDHIYMVWANERLKIPNQHVAAGVSTTVGDIAGSVAGTAVGSALGNSLISDLGSQMVDGVISSVFSSLVADAFAPSKKIHMLELTITRVSDNELTAHIVRQVIKVKGNNAPNVEKIEEDVLFTQYDPASGVYYDVPYVNNIYVPGLGKISEIPATHEKVAEAFLKYREVGALTHTTLNNTLEGVKNPFNSLQQKKLIYYNEQQMLQTNLPMDSRYHQRHHAFMGINLKANEKDVQKAQSEGGVYIADIIPESPAEIFGLLKGDILLSIDGYKMDTAEQVLSYLASLNPCDWTTVRVKRRKKVVDVPVEMSWVN